MSRVTSQAAEVLADTLALEENQQYLTFTVTGELFMLGILHIKEIIEYGNITEVPMMPEYIRGVINLRGGVVPVIDLSARFGRGKSTVSRRTCIIIVEIFGDAGKYSIGIVVDAVHGVIEIAHGDIEPSPAFGANIRSDFIAGMGNVNNAFVIILDINCVLSVEEMATLSKIGNGA